MPDRHPTGTNPGRWRVLAALFVLMLGGTLPAPLYVLYQQHMHFDALVLTLVFGIYFPFMALGLLFLGRISNQIGRRPALFGAIGAAILSTLALIFAQGLTLLFIGRALSGMANGVALSNATAFLSDLRGGDPGGGAARLSAIDQMLGLGAGPLLAGLLAQFCALPTLLSYYVLLGLLLAAGVALWRSPETQPERHAVSLRPQIGVAPERWRDFVALAITGFCVFAVIGLFTSLVPSVLQHRLHNSDHALAGGIAAGMFMLGALAETAAQRLSPNSAILASLVLIPLGMAGLMLGVVQPNLSWFVAGTAVEGVAVGLGFSNALAAVNQLGQGAQRAPVLSSFFVVTSCAAALPVIGVGVITQLANGVAADLTFGCVIALLALAALTLRLTARTA